VQITQIVMHQEHSLFCMVTLMCLARHGKWNVLVGGDVCFSLDVVYMIVLSQNKRDLLWNYVIYCDRNEVH
jgi:hypothetical protein